LRALANSLSALSAVAAAPLGLGVLALRPSWRVGLRERLGAQPAVAPGAIWVHGASVGEILAASRLIDRLSKGGHDVVTSTVTLTGREVMRRARPELPCHLAPLDHPWCVEVALARVRPRALVLIETEVWPSWIAAASRAGVPVVLVSGRVSDRSFPRYSRLRWALAPTFARLTAVGARTEIDRERFVFLGTPPDRVQITGDLKLERDEAPRPLADDLDRALAGLSLFVAGSTHSGEEMAALAALAEIESRGLRAALVLAPRRPERAAEVVRLVRAAGRSVRRRTALGADPLATGEVLVLDTVGELAPLYARADVAFVGGSLVPRGGHNILEPVFAGRPVLFGRHTSNVRHAVEMLADSGAALRVEDPRELGQAAGELLLDPEAARRIGARGRDVLLSHRGSSQRAAELIEAVLRARSDAAT
jgi:3-deoxy-D-manno-octulosonic-acid transferase